MTWKRALLLFGAALLFWLRPWRKLQALTTTNVDPNPLTAAIPAAPAEAAAPGQEAPFADASAPAGFAAPDDAFGLAPNEAPLDTQALAEPEPIAAFGADLDPALAEPESAEPTGQAAAEFAVPELDPDSPTVLAELDQDAELEAELLALGEPEPVEMAEDDLVAQPMSAAVPGSVADYPPQEEEQLANADAATITFGEAEMAERAVGETEPDDLLIIEGIGPRTSTIVTAAGYTSFADLAAADVEALREMLANAGIRTVDPSTWPEQARLAQDGRMDELRELQRTIKNGKKEA